MNKYCFFVLAIVLGLLAAQKTYASTELVLNAEQGKYPLGQYLQILEDPDHTLSLEDVQGAWSEKFEDNTADVPSFGFTTSAYWLRFTIEEPSKEKRKWLLEFGYPHLDNIEVYVPDDQGTYIRQNAGDIFPYSTRPIDYYLVVFPFHSYPEQTQTIYFRVETESSTQLPLILWDPITFAEESTKKKFMLGLFYGLMIIMAIYNLFLYIGIKDKVYLWYVLYIVAFGLCRFGLDGLSFGYLWPDYPALFSSGNLVFVGLGLGFVMMFLVDFLDIPKHLPRYYQLLKLFIYIPFLMAILIPFVPYKLGVTAITLFTLLSAPTTFIAIILCCIKKVPSSTFALFAWSAVLVAMVIQSSKNMGLLPAWELVNYAQHIGTSIEIALFSLGLANRINTIKREKISAQEETIKLKDEFVEALERMVAERTIQLQQKTNDINNMLQNMHQGVFTILQDGTVHPEYSAYLENILESDQIANTQAMNLLFNQSTLGEDIKSQVDATIGSLVGMDIMSWDFNKDLLIHEYEWIGGSGEVKKLEVDWDPIKDRNGEIEKLMVTVRDVTELRALQAESDKQKAELEVVGQILALSQKQFQTFINTAHKFLEESRQIIQETTEYNTDVIATLFRNMHTVKGNARTCGLNTVSEFSHRAEQAYDDLRKGRTKEWNTDKLLADLDATVKSIKFYEEVYSNKLERFAGNASNKLSVNKELLDMIENMADRADHLLLSPRQVAQSLHEFIKAIDTETIDSIVNEVTSGLHSIAEQLGKEFPHINVQGGDWRIIDEAIPLLKDIFGHILRNSMDHGIENKEDRESKGKASKGTISIIVESVGSNLLFKVGDDGKGLDLERLRNSVKKLDQERDSSELSDLEAANSIFISEVSTAEKVTDISGRGVGMDAVKRFIERQGGEINIVLKDGPQNARPFELHITLPKHIGAEVHELMQFGSRSAA